MTQRRVTPNRDEVVGKILDGEAILINLVTGAYYSTVGAGASIWQAIEDGRTIDETADILTREYDVTPEAARRDVERLAQELVDQKLVQIEEVDAGAPSLPSQAVPVTAARAAYESPILNTYTDMLELLALDPPMPVIGDIPRD